MYSGPDCDMAISAIKREVGVIMGPFFHQIYDEAFYQNYFWRFSLQLKHTKWRIVLRIYNLLLVTNLIYPRLNLRMTK